MNVIPIRIWYAINTKVYNARCYACMGWLTSHDSLSKCIRQARAHVSVCTYAIGDWCLVEGESNENWLIGFK